MGACESVCGCPRAARGTRLRRRRERDAAWPCPGPAALGRGGHAVSGSGSRCVGTSGWRRASGDRGHGRPPAALFLLTAEPLIQLDTALPWEGGTPAFQSEGAAKTPQAQKEAGGGVGSVTTGRPVGHARAAGWRARPRETPPGGEHGGAVPCAVQDEHSFPREAAPPGSWCCRHFGLNHVVFLRNRD